MKYIKRALPLLLVLLLSSCATLSESECRAIDWRELGRAEGAKGLASARLGSHMDACRRYNIAPDADAYRVGREEGLRQYCTLENALQLGINGSGYQQVCGGENGAQFAIIYRRGSALRAIKGDIQEVQGLIDSARRAQDGLKDLDLYKQMDQNARYLEREKSFIQSQYGQAERAVNAGFDPPYYDDGGWRSGIPYPNVVREAEKRR